MARRRRRRPCSTATSSRTMPDGHCPTCRCRASKSCGRSGASWSLANAMRTAFVKMEATTSTYSRPSQVPMPRRFLEAS